MSEREEGEAFLFVLHRIVVGLEDVLAGDFLVGTEQIFQDWRGALRQALWDSGDVKLGDPQDLGHHHGVMRDDRSPRLGYQRRVRHAG